MIITSKDELRLFLSYIKKTYVLKVIIDDFMKKVYNHHPFHSLSFEIK